jgi:DNA polymerase-3 subunit epsilon
VYAVIDLETTGLRPGWHDRVIEMAVVQLDAVGAVVREWCTLVNPGRDLGPQHIHGIRAAEVLDAPTFPQIAGHLGHLLAGRVVVAHNLRFDGPFLAAEYQRLGLSAPLDPDYGLCTMALAARYLPGCARSLVDCCTRAGVEATRAHSALYDARAAAGLLAYYLRREGQPPPWVRLQPVAGRAAWPDLPATSVRSVLRRTPGETAEHFLSRLVACLPRADSDDADAYLDILDRALLDRQLSETEARGLLEFAGTVGLSLAQVVDLHKQYLLALAAAALADGVVTDIERVDLEQVTTLLGLEPAHLGQVLQSPPPAAPTKLGTFSLAAGDIVVFTGQLDEPREVWEQRATAAGLIAGHTVTKRTRLVVAADPDTLSGKARKARGYRIPIVNVATFQRLATDRLRA